jgi:hypothetical protein
MESALHRGASNRAVPALIVTLHGTRAPRLPDRGPWSWHPERSERSCQLLPSIGTLAARTTAEHSCSRDREKYPIRARGESCASQRSASVAISDDENVAAHRHFGLRLPRSLRGVQGCFRQQVSVESGRFEVEPAVVSDTHVTDVPDIELSRRYEILPEIDRTDGSDARSLDRTHIGGLDRRCWI